MCAREQRYRHADANRLLAIRERVQVISRCIHRQSPRKNGPFVALNCAALPETLLESELFGYERGAFTGANFAKPGQIELAAGGVLFLDEVSEMSPSAQAKFLRETSKI